MNIEEHFQSEYDSLIGGISPFLSSSLPLSPSFIPSFPPSRVVVPPWNDNAITSGEAYNHSGI